jgi:hypothetical protein
MKSKIQEYPNLKNSRMIKKILRLLSIVAIPAFAQSPSIQWEKNVNGSLSGYDQAINSWKEPGGNFLLTGTSSSDAFVTKVDINGNEILRIIYDGPQNGYDKGNVVRSDASGNIYLGGITTYNLMNVPFVAKFNSTGVKLWEYVQSNVTIDGDLTALMLDNFNAPANLYFTGNKNDSSAITRLNISTGTSVWEKTFYPHGKMNDMDLDNNGHPLVCGYQTGAGGPKDADFVAMVLDIPTGYPLRGYWRNGATADSVNDGNGYFDMASKIKAGPSGTFVVFGTIYDNPNEATLMMTKFGSVGNTPSWVYYYNSPNHTGGKGIQLLTDAAFTSFYYLAGAMSTTGTYYGYTIAGKVDNTGSAVWEKEFNQSGVSLDPKDMALDANSNPHIISDGGYPADIYYEKLASANGNTVSSLQYDNMRGGGNAYEFSSNIFLDNTGHPYIIGSSNALTYTNLDLLMCRLNTNATLDWDITYDFFINAQDLIFNTQVLPYFGPDQIVTCGQTLNNVSGNDISITSYSDKGTINWQEVFDDNNGSDQPMGFEKSSYGDLFLCSYNYTTSKTSITEFYPDGTTNFSNYTTWPFSPTCFKIDSAENSFAAGNAFGVNDFAFGIYLRSSGSPSLNNTPTPATSIQTDAISIATDNTNIYVAGNISDYSGGTDGQHIYIQKFDIGANILWSTKITGFDSSAFNCNASKIVYDRATNAIYLVGRGVSIGSSVQKTILAKINVNGTVAWVRSENVSDTRTQNLTDIVVSSGNIYIAGYANLASSTSDYMLLAERWDVNGNKQWEYVFDKPTTDEEAQSIAIDNSGNIFLGGKLNGIPFASSAQAASDMLLIKLNPAGSLVWKQEYNGVGNGNDMCSNIALSLNFASNPRIYMGGNTQSTQGYYYDIGTLKFCDLPAATISHAANTSICMGGNTTLAANGASGGGTVTWSNGSSGTAIVANTTGNYYFTYTELDGCAENSDSVTINIKGAPVPVQICMVTVDDSSKHNLILWDKTLATPDVIGFNIYREDLTNIYHQIGSVPITNLSEYVDLDANANPNTTTKRYKLTTVDSCGNESAMSNYHNTIYIVSSGAGQFSWNQLYTIESSPNPVIQYMLLRDDYNTNTWHVIDSTAGTQFNINDVNFATFQPTANWRVVTQWNISCTPAARMGHGNSVQTAIVKSKSNISNNRAAGISTVTGNILADAYPNPAQNTLTVSFTSASKTSIKLRNLIGEEVITADLQNQNTTQLDISKLTSGVYLIEVTNSNGKFVKRIVKE